MPLRGQFHAIVELNEPICRDHFRLALKATNFPPTRPGQFLQILCREPDTNANDCGAFLRRPFSLAGRRDLSADQCELDIIHRVVGAGTAWLSRLKPDERVNILGPLGNEFPLPPQGAKVLLVGGGVGIPPMLYLAERVAGNAIAFCGATTRDLLPLELLTKQFQRHQITPRFSTDDGTHGSRGYVTQALEKYLNDQPSESRFVLYTCGPELMMKRVAAIALERNITCHVAVERAMACGMGTCQSCVIRVRQGTGDDSWAYKLTCTDGPVFQANLLLW